MLLVLSNQRSKTQRYLIDSHVKQKNGKSTHLKSWKHLHFGLFYLIDNQICRQLTFCWSTCRSTNYFRINTLSICKNLERLALYASYRGALERSKTLGGWGGRMSMTSCARTVPWPAALAMLWVRTNRCSAKKYRKYPLFINCIILNANDLIIVDCYQCSSSDSHERRSVFSSACLYFKFTSASWLGSLSWDRNLFYMVASLWTLSLIELNRGMFFLLSSLTWQWRFNVKCAVSVLKWSVVTI